MFIKHIQKLLFILFVLGVGNLQAQEQCGAMHHWEEQVTRNPQLQQIKNQIEQHTINYQSNTGKSATIITIPVVVHVVYNTAIENLSLAQIQSQLDILNEDFRRMNADAVMTPADFLPVAADTEIQFCLANVDPDGFVTDGITRTMTNATSFNMSGNPIMFGATGGHDIWDRDQYLNIWVGDLSGGLLGYAQFPGGPASTDGIVVDYLRFGNIGTATAPYDLGRTATHEVGHWLNLRHIWGDGNCSLDDGVSDTPVAGNSNGTSAPCTYPGPDSCPGGFPDMFQNFMDYSDDVCMNLFTQGQKTRMRAILDDGGFRNPILSSMGCAGNGIIPTCDDNIQNGLETGVDCGGDCPVCPEVIANCTVEGFQPSLWTIEELPSTHDGEIIITNIPDMVTLVGSDDNGGLLNQSNYCIAIHGSGTITFDWAYTTTDIDAVWDPFGYSINGVFTALTINGSAAPQNGVENIAVMDGDIFCLSQQTLDGAFGAATTIVSNIVSPSVCIEDIYVNDPCACEDPDNIITDNQFLFHDILVIEAPSMQEITLLNNDGNLLNATGIPIPLGTPFVETSPGIYELEFFSLSGQAATVTVGNDAIMSEFTTTSCIVSACISIEAILVSDPCACDDPENIMENDQLLFHDVLLVEATPMQIISLLNNDGNLLTATGTSIPVGTAFVETSPGIYELEFYSLSEQAATISIGNTFISSEFTTTSCLAEDCIVLIPTMSQWGLLLFALLNLNLSLILIGRLERSRTSIHKF